MDVNVRRELANTDLTASSAFSRNRLVGWPALTRDGSSTSDRSWPDLPTPQAWAVEGEQVSAHALVKLLWYGGHPAHVSFDGFSAVRATATLRPNAVLMDLEVSFTEGCLVARHLRFDYPSIDCLIIAVTERAHDTRRKQCIEAGIDLLLVKPLDPEVLETLLMLECIRASGRQAPRLVSYNSSRQLSPDSPAWE